MVDSYERDKDGNVVGKAPQPHPAEPKDPAPNNNARPADVPTFNTTLADRAKGTKPKPVPRPEGAAHNSTFSERTKAAAKRGKKAVDSSDAEDKSVTRVTKK